jgi:hypothetical protein
VLDGAGQVRGGQKRGLEMHRLGGRSELLSVVQSYMRQLRRIRLRNSEKSREG